MNASIMLIALSLLAGARTARAEFTFACGDNRDQGVQKAQVAFVDNLESPMKLMLAGHPVEDEKLGVKSRDNGRWLVSVDEGVGQEARQYLFEEGAAASVQLNHVTEKGEILKDAKLPCTFVQKN